MKWIKCSEELPSEHDWVLVKIRLRGSRDLSPILCVNLNLRNDKPISWDAGDMFYRYDQEDEWMSLEGIL